MQFNKCKTPMWIAFSSSFLCACFTHLFALTNVLHNYDDIASMPGGYGTGTVSGRWFLEFIGQLSLDLGLNYNLPLLNGLVFLLLISFSASILVKTLHITKKASAALIGILFSVFPPVASALFFRFTVIFYGFSILFSILAPFFMVRYRFGYIGSILFIALSLGIYQAYIPMTIGIFVLLLIQEVLNGKLSVISIIQRGLLYCTVLIFGFLLYYGITKLSTAAAGKDLLDYQGIQTMGQISLIDLPYLIWKAFKDVCLLPIRDYCGISYRQVIQTAYLLLIIVSFPLLVSILKNITKTISARIVLLLLCLVFPVAINFIEIMVPDGWIYTLMVYPLVLLPCLPLILLEYLPYQEQQSQKISSTIAKSVCIATILLSSLYVYYTNVNYTALHYENRQVENYLNSMVTQVRMTEGFRSDMEWVLIGDVADPLLGSMWAEETAYGGNSYALHLINSFSFSDWIENYIGYNIAFASEDTIAAFTAMEEVQHMPCWPDYGSIQIIHDTVIIKFQSVSQAP